MSKWNRDPERIARDLVIAFWHPDYQDTRCVDALADLKRRRRA